MPVIVAAAFQVADAGYSKLKQCSKGGFAVKICSRGASWNQGNMLTSRNMANGQASSLRPIVICGCKHVT